MIAEAQEDLVTAKDRDASLSPMRTDLAVRRTEISQIKWMLGFGFGFGFVFVIGGIIAVLAKLRSQ